MKSAFSATHNRTENKTNIWRVRSTTCGKKYN